MLIKKLQLIMLMMTRLWGENRLIIQWLFPQRPYRLDADSLFWVCHKSYLHSAH